MATFNIYVSYFDTCIFADIDYFIFKIVIHNFMRYTRGFNIIFPTVLLHFWVIFLSFYLFHNERLVTTFFILLHKFREIIWKTRYLIAKDFNVILN